MRKSLLVLLVLIVSVQLYGQNFKVRDNPHLRLEFENQKLINPSTGLIPNNIRYRELKFAERLASNSRISSLDETTIWNRRGPFNVGGRTRALAVDVLNEDVILAGGISGGMWRSDDAGSTWVKVLSASEIQSVSCIAQDPRAGQTNTWYYGTGEISGNSASASGAFYLGDGIYKSIDNGLTWNVLPSTVDGNPESITFDGFEVVNEIVVNPTNGDVFAATFYGIFRLPEGDTEFAEVLDNPNRGWSDVVVTTDGILYASLEGDGVYRSTDGGANWDNITDSNFASGLANGDRIELGLAPSAQDTLYVIAMDGSNHTLWMYDNNTGGTATWSDRSANIPSGSPFGGDVGDYTSQGGYDMLVTVKPDDPNFVIIGGTNLYRSTDGFATSINTTGWIGGYSTANNISSYTNQHPDQHSFQFLSGNKAISGNDGGVQITNDITDTTPNGVGETVDWNPLNNGYFTSQIYAVSVGPGDQIIAGFQDNGNWLTNSTSESTSWDDNLVNVFGGDGTYNAINSDGTVRYISTQFARTFRLEYSDADDLIFDSFTQIDPSSGYTGVFVTPFYLDPNNDDIFYLGGDSDLFVNTQVTTGTRSAGWKSISLPNNQGDVSEIGTTTSDMVYVGTDRGEVYKIENPAETSPVITDVTSDIFPSGAYVSSVGVNQFDADELIVVFSNYGVQSIFYSNDGGVSWDNISGNLEENSDGSGSGPSVRATRIAGNGYEYIVGTSTGLYSTRVLDGINTVWVQEGASNIGNVVINHIVNRTDGLTVVGTHGNGIYSSTIIPELDMSVKNIDEPVSQVFSEISDVKATVTNNGGTTVSSYDLTLMVGDNEIVSETIDVSLFTGENHTHTFSEQVDFTSIGSYDISVSVTLAGDLNSANDSQLVSIFSLAAPSSLTLSNNTILENESAGTAIGTFSTDDEDDDQHDYSLVEGDGADDNSSFSIISEELRSREEFEFTTQSAFTIRVQTEDDDGNTFVRSFSIDVSEVLGTNELDELGIVVYPNPFTSGVYLEMINDHIGIIQVTVSDLQGKSVLLSKKYEKSERQTKSMLDLEELSAGLYIIKFQIGDETYSGRLLKE
ncbi:T9SS type A sorting domain-containing protein [Ekhidna sp.]